MDLAFRYINIFSTVPGFIFALIHWKKLVLKVPSVLKKLVLLNFVGECVSIFTVTFIGHNLWFFATYTVCESYLMVQLFMAFNGYKYEKWLTALAFIIGGQLFVFIALDPSQYPTISRVIQHVFITSLFTVHLVKILRGTSTYRLFNVALVLAFLGYYINMVFHSIGFHLFINGYGKFFSLYEYTINIWMNLFLLYSLYNYIKQYANQH